MPADRSEYVPTITVHLTTNPLHSDGLAHVTVSYQRNGGQQFHAGDLIVPPPVAEVLQAMFAGALSGRCRAPIWGGRYQCVLPPDHDGAHEGDSFGREAPIPCPSTALSVLGMVGEPAHVRCGLLEGHDGPHRMGIEWTDPV
jgi:hypothetical protein